MCRLSRNSGILNLPKPKGPVQSCKRIALFYYGWQSQNLFWINGLDCVWNVMAHAQKPDFVFCRKGRVHLNLRGRQFSRLLVAELCASALVMLDTPRSEVVWEYWLPTPLASFPFTSPPVRHCVPSGFKSTVPYIYYSGESFHWQLNKYTRLAWIKNWFQYTKPLGSDIPATDKHYNLVNKVNFSGESPETSRERNKHSKKNCAPREIIYKIIPGCTVNKT